MSLNKLGLILNLIGSIFLGLHIIGMERLKLLEEKIKNLPKKVSERIFTVGLGSVLVAELKRQSKKWPGGPEQWGAELVKHFKNGFSLPKDLPKVKRNLFLYRFSIVFMLSILIAMTLWFATLPLILLLLILTRPFAFIQKALKLESFLGLIGILLLITGFILQIIN